MRIIYICICTYIYILFKSLPNPCYKWVVPNHLPSPLLHHCMKASFFSYYHQHLILSNFKPLPGYYYINFFKCISLIMSKFEYLLSYFPLEKILNK